MRTTRARPVRVDERLTLIAIESVESHGHRSRNGCEFSALVEPKALVVCGPQTVRALDMRGNPMDVEALRQDVPDLDAALVICGRSRDLVR